MGIDMDQMRTSQGQKQHGKPGDQFDVRPEDIAAEAYALWEARGHQEGRDLEDWLEAEQRLRNSGDPSRKVPGASTR